PDRVLPHSGGSPPRAGGPARLRRLAARLRRRGGGGEGEGGKPLGGPAALRVRRSLPPAGGELRPRVRAARARRVPPAARAAGRAGVLPDRAPHLGPAARMARGARERATRPDRRVGERRPARAAAVGLVRARAGCAAAGGSRRANPLDARGGRAALRREGARKRAVADRAGVGARAGRRSGAGGRALCAGGRPPLPRDRFRRRSTASAVLDRKRWTE